MYKYKVFGLNITSDMELNELLPAEGETDVEIIKGKVPEELNNPYEKNDFFQASKKEFLFKVSDIAWFYVSNGNKIVVETIEGASDATVRVFLLAIAFCTLLLQRGILPMHGSALVVDGKGVIITGASGSGKSSLSNALLQKGYSFLADDLSPLDFYDDGSIWLLPAFPQQKLCKDTADNMGLDVRHLSRVEADLDKYVLPVSTSFVRQPVRLATICELNAEDCDKVRITELQAMDKLTVIINQTFKSRLLPYLDIGKEHFELCAKVSKGVQVLRIYRPHNKFTTDEQVELLRMELNKSIS